MIILRKDLFVTRLRLNLILIKVFFIYFVESVDFVKHNSYTRGKGEIIYIYLFLWSYLNLIFKEDDFYYYFGIINMFRKIKQTFFYFYLMKLLNKIIKKEFL